ncbi:MAG: hypothetical protein V5A56_10420 [Halolamina sp.]
MPEAAITGLLGASSLFQPQLVGVAVDQATEADSDYCESVPP